MKLRIAVTGVLLVALLGTVVPACAPRVAEMADGYAAIVPAVLQAGSPQAVSVALFKGQSPAAGRVTVALYRDGREIALSRSSISGKGTIQLNVPAVPEGEYQLVVRGASFQDEAKVKVENNFLVFLETDKPIYKPGQTLHVRVLTLNSELKPVTESVTIEVMDAKGTKIFRTVPKTDDFGIASVDLPISTEPNLGVWKINATAPKAKAQLDVRVEEYVLPKYELKVNLPKEWFLPDETIRGKVAAEYSFGKPVKGELEIKATRYVGRWQQYATFNVPIDAEAEFTIPAAGYVAGVPGAGGQGNVKLDFAVVERSTGYQEKTSKLLTVAQSSLILQLIPSGAVFKPGLPFSFMVISKAPDNKLVDTQVRVRTTYFDKDLKQIGNEEKTVNTSGGKALVEITPRAESVALSINATAQGASANRAVEAGYSPTGNFIHLEQTSPGVPDLGEKISFKVYSTLEAVNFYYEVVANGRVVFTDYTKGNQISFTTTPQMAPAARLLVYQILPNAEVAADYLPFKVNADYPHRVKVEFSSPEAKPGDGLTVNIETEGEARVGIAAVDKSVFILAENRLNLQQVFDELEKLYMKPQAELHEVNIFQGVTSRGAKELFRDAGVIVLTNNNVPEGKEYKSAMGRGALPPMLQFADKAAAPAPAPAPAPMPTPAPAPRPEGLAEVQRVRQYFPETWLWEYLNTDRNGKGSLKVIVPDSITTWMLRAVALSRSKGLGVGETQLKAFQPFFLSIDLPYSAIRGEEFPVRVAIYNYLNEPQTVLVQLDKADWFDLLDNSEKTIDIKPNDIGGAEFKIRPVKLGTANAVKITARSRQAADAVIKTLIIEAEGVFKELVDNLMLNAGASRELSTTIPPSAVDGSGRAYLTVTAGYLTQTIEGLEALLQMPFGCGEQNMIVFAPDVFITKYLKQSGQLKPEIMAKAEKLMLTGYQRELTYRRSDGSFSAFGNSDKEGSLWLTAFVLKSFFQAKDLMYIDDAVLDRAKSWITSKQKPDGSFDAVGFVHHQEMMGGVKGKDALTAYVAVALMQAGERASSAKAISYLEGRLGGMEDPYAVALTTYALELGKSLKAGEAHDKLMKLAKEDENGLHWGSDGIEPLPLPPPGPRIMPVPPRQKTSDIEATGYATLALLKHGDVLNAGKAARWLVSKRNAYGGFGSTQDTVVGLEALTEFAGNAKADVDLTVRVESGGKAKELRIKPENYDVLQVTEVPVNDTVKVSASGKGEVITQLVRRFNLPEAGKKPDDILKVNVDYDVTQVAVNDLVKVTAEVSFNPPLPMEAGMTVLDISVPTGFAAVKESVDQVVQKENKIKRYDISGRKVIFYIENMLPGDRLAFSFNVRALYPVKAKGVSSQAYSYYQPEIQAETLGRDIVVVER